MYNHIIYIWSIFILINKLFYIFLFILLSVITYYLDARLYAIQNLSKILANYILLSIIKSECSIAIINTIIKSKCRIAIKKYNNCYVIRYIIVSYSIFIYIYVFGSIFPYCFNHY